MWKLTALCLTAALLGLVVKRGTPEAALLLSLGAITVGLLGLWEVVSTVKELMERLVSRSGLEAAWFAPLYKTLGIAVVVRLGSGLCRDAGEAALGSLLETAGALCALAAAVPLLERVLGLVMELQP